MEQDGVDISCLNFAEIPFAHAGDNYKGPRLRKRRLVTKDIETETKRLRKEAKKDQKKEEKKKAAALTAYSEPPQKGNSDKSSSDSVSKLIDSLLKPPQSTSSETPILLPFSTSSETQTTEPLVSISLTSTHTSTQNPTPISSETIQTQTTPLISTTFSNQTPEYLDALDREIYITNPVPLNSAPPLKQPHSDSEVALPDVSPIKSADFKFSDPQPPPTHTLPQTHTNPPHTPTSNPLSYDFQGPSTPSEEYFSEPASPETINIQSSSPLPVTDPLYAIIIYQPRPLHLLECINFFSETAPKRASELLASTSAYPENEQAAWKNFQDWLNSELSCIIHSSEQAMESCE